MPKKGVKRPLGAPPTNEELSAYSETELLYKSNLFRLSTAELIKEVVPPQSSQLEVAVRALRGEILSLPPAELSWEDRGIGKLPLVSHAELSGLRLANHKVSLPWAPPEHVELVGSYLLRTVVRPSLDVDVAVRIPRACLLSKDYLDHRYVDKRQLYLAHLGAQLAKPSAATAATAAATAATAATTAAAELRSASFVWLPHHQDPRWPVLQLQMPAVSGGWVVRLIPVLPADAFAAAKLAPERVNLRDRTSATAKGATAGADAPGAAPSPEYNNRLALEASYAPALGLLHATYAAAGASGALREATILLKVWLRQRSVQQAGGVTGFQLSLLLVHLLRARVVTRSMGAYHVFRVVLSFLAKTMLEDHPVALPPPPAGGGGEDEHEHEGEAGQVHAVAAARFGRHFAWVLADSSAGVNYGAGVTRGALRELQEQAARSLRAIDSAALDDAAAFAELFTTPQPPPLKYDALFSFPFPPLSGPAAEEAVGKARAAAEAAAAAARTAGATAAAAEAAAAGGHGSARTKGSAAADATDGGTAAVALSEGVDSACAAAAEAVLSAGLSRRCGLVRSWVAPLAEQPLRRTTTSAPAPAGEGVRLHHVGVLLEPSLAAGLVDRGPAPGGEAAAAWVGLWGDKSETRRFRDGAIVHAVVWSAEEVSRHLIPVQVVRHLLRRHLGVERVASSLGCVERALRCGGACGTWTSAAPKYIAAYEKLAAAIRQLSGLPLAVVSIQPVGAVFSHCEEFPPSAAGDDEVAAAAGDGDAACGPSLARFVVQFESSGKWPDDVSAVAALKTAFYLKMAELLDAQAAGVRCEPRRGGLAVRVDGLLLFGTIVHAKEEKLLAAAGDEPAAAALRLSTVGTAHTAAMHAIASRHAAFGPTVRLVKRWLHCQLLSGIFPPQLVELLVAHLFSPAAPRPPGSALLGFLRALWLLETHDFDAEPLLVGLDDGISPEGRAAAQRAFESARGGEGGGAAIWIATDAAPSGSPWCARGPSVAAVRRVQRLAASALRCLEGTMRHATGAHGGGGADKAGADGVLVCDGDGGARLATEAEIAAAALHVFEAPLHEFDALLRLDPARVPHPELRLQGTAERAAESRAFANLKPRGVAVLEYVRSLRCEYGHLALFFYDRHGGNTVALKWRPRAFLPLPFRPDDALGRLLVPRAAMDAAGASHAAWLLPNVPEVLEAMGAMGKPLAAQVQACSSGSRRVVGA